LPGGEDTDLVWRALRHGASVTFVPEARVHHAVIDAGPMGMLRYAWHWNRTVPLFAKHPDLRRQQLHAGLFWSPVHAHLARAALALLLPRRLWPLALWLALPYARRLAWRRTGPLLAPWILLMDLVEVAGIVRGAVRHRVPVV
jgi:GT2 family glycosyltransferase